jgi:hypothetical protein
VIAKFRAIKVRLNYVEEIAKNAIGKMMPENTEIAYVLEEGDKFKSLINGFNRDLEILSTESNSMHQVFMPLDVKDEKLAVIFKEYRNFRGELDGNTANYSLDFARYNTDEQEFLGSLNSMAGKQAEFITVCNMVIDRYNLLIEEVEKTFDQWQQCNKMLEMLQMMDQKPVDIKRICLN